MDRLDAMSVLIATVDSGSLSAAGRRLGMPLTTVSRKIADLEAHLTVRLLTRTTRHLELTDAGRSYVAACRRILDDVGEAERAAAGEYSKPKGDLVVTAPIVFGRLHVLPIVSAFLKTYPDINVRLVLADSVVDLLDDRIDLAVRIGPLSSSGLIAARVGSIGRVVCASPAYLRKHGRPKAPADLAAYDCIAFEGISPLSGWEFAVGRSATTVAVRARLVVNTAEAAIDAAIAGVGIVRALSYQVAAAVAAGTLDVLLTPFEPEPWPVHLVYAGRGMLPLKLRAFLDFSTPRLKKTLNR
jgi:DNA-binding transcriptional LysR family regulator